MRSSTGIKQLLTLVIGSVFLTLSLTVFSDSAVVKGSKAAGLESCVAPTKEIRRNHKDYLKHDRVLTVHKGVRDIKYSLAECVDCHAGKDAQSRSVPVNAPGQFCAKCHEYLAVSLTCFQCHRSTPDEQHAALGEGGGNTSLGLLPDSGKFKRMSPEVFARVHASILESDHE